MKIGSFQGIDEIEAENRIRFDQKYTGRLSIFSTYVWSKLHMRRLGKPKTLMELY